ncbi:class I SAM-dependent methyltransferase [Saccharicrinis sp. FJH54]|uniref:class I SAM-dependent methyltransferase n=1 Tax=Saccharicrinis sp. FJH54 TaxID=3344665 RepID=UPI0035D41DDD
MNYIDINRKLWNERSKVHFGSKFYDNASFLSGRNTLNQIELDLLRDISGKRILHLQCHFGQDTLSLARMGAVVTGVDFSDVAIEKARELGKSTNLRAEFICCDIYDLPNHLDETFDIVFSSYGTIGWLPDIERWAGIINHYLKPGGTFIFAEFHPVVWMFSNDFTTVTYGYFNTGSFVETENGSYTDGSEAIKLESVSWNHTLSDVFTALKQNGILVEIFREFDYSPYDCFQNTVETEPGKFMIKGMEEMLPMVYALKGVKNSDI